MGPSFFLVGAAKSGTTAIANYLGQHPDIYIPQLKEPKYFSFEDNRFPHNGPGDEIVDRQVVRSFTDYEALFSREESIKVKGDCSVDNLFFEKVPQRIKGKYPNAKILIVLREPVERAYSAYMHLRRDGREVLSFEEALEAEEKRSQQNWEFFWKYQGVGMYSRQVARYLDVFNREQLLILLYDDLKAEPYQCIRTIYEFLKVDPNFEPDLSRKFNVSGASRFDLLHKAFNKPNIFKSIVKKFIPLAVRKNIRTKVNKFNLSKVELADASREKLKGVYENDMRQLSVLIGRDLNHWFPEIK